MSRAARESVWGRAEGLVTLREATHEVGVTPGVEFTWHRPIVVIFRHYGRHGLGSEQLLHLAFVEMTQISNLFRRPVYQIFQVLMVECAKLPLHVAAKPVHSALKRHYETVVLAASYELDAIGVQGVLLAGAILFLREQQLILHITVLLAATLRPNVLWRLWAQNDAPRNCQRRPHLLYQDFYEFCEVSIFVINILIHFHRLKIR